MNPFRLFTFVFILLFPLSSVFHFFFVSFRLGKSQNDSLHLTACSHLSLTVNYTGMHTTHAAVCEQDTHMHGKPNLHAIHRIVILVVHTNKPDSNSFARKIHWSKWTLNGWKSTIECAHKFTILWQRALDFVQFSHAACVCVMSTLGK